MAAVDDLLRDLAVALVIDPAPGAEAADHPAAGRALAGSRFAIVDPRLATLRRHPVTDRVSTVLVATGGGGLGGVGRAIAAGIVAAVPALAVRLATPPGAAPAPDGVEAVCRVDGLAPELARADIVVTAGGVTLLESLCLGRPTITYVLADNQRRQAGGAAAAGAVELVEMSEIPLAVLELVASAERRGALARRARQVIDGLGASRVAEAIRDL
jgi:spore coat polysaccharide biosynthesis predicted glycosyltransferase SpsG